MDKSDELLRDIMSDQNINQIARQNSYQNTNQVIKTNQVNYSSYGKKVIPGGVKFVSILGYIATAFLFVSGAFILALGILVSIGTSSIDSSFLNQFSGLLLQVIMDFSILVGIILIILSIISLILSIFLWKGRNWARITIIILSGLTVLSTLYFIVTGGYGNFFYLSGFVSNTIIALYLILSKKVKEAFSPALP